ncbi:hypothetical protein GCM10009606_38270 [Nocardioides aquiterrae]|uniref:Uncharacterized protein n=1 Tax=Nocardioides aquiterrae TaxID=203799 RepID=A0ABN1UN87_9ACTN
MLAPAIDSRRTVVFWPSFCVETVAVPGAASSSVFASVTELFRETAEAEVARNGTPVTARAETAAVASPRFMPLLIMLIFLPE